MTYLIGESTRRIRQTFELDFTLEEHVKSFDRAHHVGCSTAKDMGPKDVVVSRSPVGVSRN